MWCKYVEVICDSCAVKRSIKYGENVHGEAFPHIEFCSQRPVGLGWHRRLVQLAEHEKAGTPDLLLGFGSVHAHLSLPRVLRQNKTGSKRRSSSFLVSKHGQGPIHAMICEARPARSAELRETRGARARPESARVLDRSGKRPAISSSLRRSLSVLLFVSSRCSLL